MLTSLHRVLFALASGICLAVYNIRAYAYCKGILKPTHSGKFGVVAALAINELALAFSLCCALPTVLSLIIIYFAVLLQFIYLFQGDLVSAVFGSGTIMFHIMNVKMIVTSIFILIYRVPSYDAFRESGLYLFCAFVTILVLLVSLEIFQRVINLSMVQTLMRNRGQLRFATSSMMLINIYLLMLGVAYAQQAYSSLAGGFLLPTALLLFGAFYTSFRHAINMSLMAERELRSKRLEEQLQATREDVQELQTFAFTDTLTAVHNRRFGLEELNRLIEKQAVFCLCFLDIDRLKYVNDTFGHAEGDRYILDVVKVLSGACRKEDILSHMGGDEFMLLLPGIPYRVAAERMQGIRQTVLRIPSTYHPSISYGIVEVGADAGLSVSQILRDADQQMYQFKRAHHMDARV
nr:GGDEF domain-containing protein [Maliibacterium massiliense]